MVVGHCKCINEKGKKCDGVFFLLKGSSAKYCHRHQECNKQFSEEIVIQDDEPPKKNVIVITDDEELPKKIKKSMGMTDKEFDKFLIQEKKAHQEQEKIKSEQASTSTPAPAPKPKPILKPPPKPKPKQKQEQEREQEPPVRLNKGSCEDLGGFTNSANSCYLDSTLYSILHEENKYISDLILYVDVKTLSIPSTRITLTTSPELLKITLQIQTLLRIAQNVIHGGGLLYCGDLRKAFTTYDVIYQGVTGIKVTKVNWTSAQLSPYDVINQITKIFSTPSIVDFVHEREDVISINPLEVVVTETYITRRPFVYGVHQNQIADYDPKRNIFNNKEKEFNLKDLLRTVEVIDDGKNITAYIHEYLSDAPLLFIHLDRIAGQHIVQPKSSRVSAQEIPMSKITTVVHPDEQIRVKSRTLNLVSITIHLGGSGGGHYIAYIKCGDSWYLYNDVGFKSLVKIGAFNQLDEHILTDATDFLYI
jgi:hypothetical protein